MKTVNYPFLHFCRNTAVLLLFFCVILPAKGQKVKTYKIWVTLLDETKVKGTLYGVNEDQLVLVGGDLNQVIITPESIETIKLRRTGKIGRGAWIGAAIGTATGALVGLATNDRDEFLGDPIYSMTGGGIVGLIIGTGVGIGIGTGKEKFVINGDESAFRLQLPVLREYVPRKIPTE